MEKEVTLVLFMDFDAPDLCVSKIFENVREGENYFCQVIKDKFPEQCKDWDDDNFIDCLCNGYYSGSANQTVFISEVPIKM